ncbi:MAG: PaaI family thioesterase [Flavobacteriales bacterium]|mgnify:CR=1 FL=1
MTLTLPNSLTLTKEDILLRCNSICDNTLMETLNITFTDCTDTSLEASMPVSPKVHQPMGILHGGATAALIETVGSAVSVMFINPETHIVKGIEITVNHLKSVKSGNIRAVAHPIHAGRSTHIFQVDVFNEDNQRIAFGKMTNMVLEKR